MVGANLSLAFGKKKRKKKKLQTKGLRKSVLGGSSSSSVFGKKPTEAGKGAAVGVPGGTTGKRRLSSAGPRGRFETTTKRQKKFSDMHEAAKERCADVFDYDGWKSKVDAKEKKVKRGGYGLTYGGGGKSKQAQTSRYIAGLKQKAAVRAKEYDLVYERRLQKERKEEDHMYADKPKYVTAGYKAKLAEDKKFREMQAQRDQEMDEDPRRKGGMGDFYRNMLAKGVGIGARSKGGRGVDDEAEGGANPSAARRALRQKHQERALAETAEASNRSLHRDQGAAGPGREVPPGASSRAGDDKDNDGELGAAVATSAAATTEKDASANVPARAPSSAAATSSSGLAAAASDERKAHSETSGSTATTVTKLAASAVDAARARYLARLAARKKKKTK